MWKTLVLGLFTLEVCVATCPIGFIQHGSSCYNIFHIKASWAEANYYCSMIQSSLLSIDDAGEEQFITGYIGRLGAGAFSSGSLWIGGTSMFSGSWIWTQTRTGLTYTAWAPGEPSNDPLNRCIAVGFKTQFKWTANVCEQLNNFICESLA
ncbi:perlucin-like [Ostrea edulis]|uniref:perlucin-like n=1 Tax=Ostrea edulis TaxID=37623 RepID=UPI0020943029|nr:perlucin-like [Ostrea edulis]